MRTTSDFTVTFAVAETPAEAFTAINNVKGWWSEEVRGYTDQVGGVWYYHFQDVHHCTIEVTELIPNKKVVWHVLDNFFKFTEDKTEWIGNTIVFDITEKNGQTEVTFTQLGLTPADECFEICEGAWTNYVTNSLKKLIETGIGKPNASGKPRTEYEEELSDGQHS